VRWLVNSNQWLRDQVGPHSLMKCGWGNGYITIHPKHPWFNVPYMDIDVDVHYGLTFGSIIEEETIGFFDALTEKDIGYYMIGFDTNHYDDDLTKWPKERVEREAQRLLEQALSFNGKYNFLI